jgi:serine/threonine-protein kinase
MATGISGRSFLDVVKRSGVVSEDDLQRTLEVLKQRSNVSWDDSESLAQAFIAQGVITRWQADKMLQGKHKGFSLGPYRLLDMLGKGGMGAVYLGEHTLMRRRCAIKVLPSKNIGSRSYLERFYREAQAVAAMDHPNIVRAYDVNQAKVGDADVHFLAMEYVEGRDLQRIVDEDHVLPYYQAAEYVRQAAEGLAHAHGAGMVHRDIKPANLLVNSREVVKILDLGLAKFYGDQAEAASLTVAHNETVLGTADYLAPEQAVDSHNTDHRADIYSLGCTFYFLLTGHPPFCEGSVAQRLLNHQMKAPPPIRDDRPDAPDSLLVIVDRMMAKKREERYQSAQEVADDLAVWLVENGNDEWRERNPDLVRKVGDSWRADTKVVSGSLVDTAELELDEDLSLAPLEDHVDELPKDSPLVTDVSDVPLSTSAPVAELKPKSDVVKPRSDVVKPKSDAKPGSSVRKSGPVPVVPAEPAPVVTPELPPLAAPDLVSLDELHSLDVLSTEPLAAGVSSVSSQSDASVLSSGLGLGQAPAPNLASPAAAKKPAESSGIPMPAILALVGLAAVVVIGLVIAIAMSGDQAEPVANQSLVTPPTTVNNGAPPTHEQAANPIPTVAQTNTAMHGESSSTPVETQANSSSAANNPVTPPEAAPTPESNAAPQASPQVLKVTPSPANEPSPEPVKPEVAGNSQSPKAEVARNPNETAPENVAPPVAPIGQQNAPPQANVAQQPAVSEPAPNVETPPAVAETPLSTLPPQAVKLVMATLLDTGVKVEVETKDQIVGQLLSMIDQEAGEALASAQVKRNEQSPNRLHIDVSAEADSKDPNSQVKFAVSAYLEVTIGQHTRVIWRDAANWNGSVRALLSTPGLRSIRRDLGNFFKRPINELRTRNPDGGSARG